MGNSSSFRSKKIVNNSVPLFSIPEDFSVREPSALPPSVSKRSLQPGTTFRSGSGSKEADESDTSLEDFFKDLNMHIFGSKIQNSFWDFKYPILNNKNQLYQAMESYKNNGTIFYSKFLTDNPGVKIKRISEIFLGENCYCEGRGAYHDGTYFLNFTVYFEKEPIY